MKPRIIFVAATMLSSAFAADITLTDGRTFKDASIASQTPRKVMIKHAAGLTSVAKQQLPADLLAKFPIDEAAALARESAEKARQSEAQHAARLRAERDASAASNPVAAEKTDVPGDTKLAQQTARAKTALEQYFREKYSWSPGTERVVEVTIGDIRQTEGWSDRWTVTGRAVIRDYTHDSGSSNTTGISTRDKARDEYRAAKSKVETREFTADYIPGSSTPLNVTLR